MTGLITTLQDELFLAVDLPDVHWVESILADAAAEGLLQQLLAAADQKGRTVLHQASRRGDRQVFKMLLGEGVALNAADNEGNMAIMTAAAHCRLEAVRQLLAAGASLHAAPDEPDFKAFVSAVAGGSAEVLQLLLSKVALPSKVADRAAAIAVNHRHTHLLQHLYAAGADKTSTPYM